MDPAAADHLRYAEAALHSNDLSLAAKHFRLGAKAASKVGDNKVGDHESAVCCTLCLAQLRLNNTELGQQERLDAR